MEAGEAALIAASCYTEVGRDCDGSGVEDIWSTGRYGASRSSARPLRTTGSGEQCLALDDRRAKSAFSTMLK